MVATRPDISPQGIYSQAEASRLLGVDRHTLARWAKSLRLVPHHSDGHSTWFLGKDIVRAWTGR